MNNKIKFFKLNQKYFNYLFYKKKLNEFENKPKRVYFGYFRIMINSNLFLIPASSKINKYWDTKEDKEIFPYTLLLRDNNNKPVSTLLINKMIPVLDNNNFAYQPSINDISDLTLLTNELTFLNKPENIAKVEQLANEIYEKRVEIFEKQIDINTVSDTNIKFAVDFKQAEILMYKYAFDLYDKGLLKEEPLLPEWIGTNGVYNDEFREIHKWLEQNGYKDGVDDKNVYLYNEHWSETTNIWLVKKDKNTLTLLEEQFCLQPDDDVELYVRPEIFEVADIKVNQNLDAREVFELVDQKVCDYIDYAFCLDPNRNDWNDNDDCKNELIEKINNWGLNIIKKDLDELIDKEQDEDMEM